MNRDKVIVSFVAMNRKIKKDIEIPLNITANELVVALNTAYKLGIDVSNIKMCFLKAENPIALLKGNKTLNEFGLRNGSIIYFTN